MNQFTEITSVEPQNLSPAMTWLNAVSAVIPTGWATEQDTARTDTGGEFATRTWTSHGGLSIRATVSGRDTYCLLTGQRDAWRMHADGFPPNAVRTAIKAATHHARRAAEAAVHPGRAGQPQPNPEVLAARLADFGWTIADRADGERLAERCWTGPDGTRSVTWYPGDVFEPDSYFVTRPGPGEAASKVEGSGGADVPPCVLIALAAA
jgi:hypothetical protein